MCATEGAELNVLFLSKLGQENNVGTAGLQCKPLRVEPLICCCFVRSARYLHMSLLDFNTFPIYVISIGSCVTS